jgi:hypothetical protein
VKLSGAELAAHTRQAGAACHSSLRTDARIHLGRGADIDVHARGTVCHLGLDHKAGLWLQQRHALAVHRLQLALRLQLREVRRLLFPRLQQQDQQQQQQQQELVLMLAMWAHTVQQQHGARLGVCDVASVLAKQAPELGVIKVLHQLLRCLCAGAAS